MVSLGESGAEKNQFKRLEFRVSVRANFAIQIDFFVLRCGPFHGWLLEIGTSIHRKYSTV
jgi:hypothetical protein